MTKRTDIKTRMMIGCLKMLARLPFWALYGISNFIYFVLKHMLHYRKKVIDGNLRACFPQLSDKEINHIRDQYYHHLADLIVETVKLLHISDKQLDERIEVKGAEIVDECARAGVPVMLYLGHFGNWEWVQNISRHYQSGIESFYVYKPLRDEGSNEMYYQIRHRFDAEGIAQKQVPRALLRMKGEGRNFIVGFIADHRPNSSTSPHHTTFMGLDTDYAIAAEPIGKRMDARHVYLDVEKTGRGRYRMTFVPIVPADNDTENPITKEYFNMLEATIRRQPPYWLWSHKRWLYSHDKIASK